MSRKCGKHWDTCIRNSFLVVVGYRAMETISLKGVLCLIEAYEHTRRKHIKKLRQIGHTTSHYGQSFSSKTINAWNGLSLAEAPSLPAFRSNFLYNNERVSLPFNTIEGILQQKQMSRYILNRI